MNKVLIKRFFELILSCYGSNEEFRYFAGRQLFMKMADDQT